MINFNAVEFFIKKLSTLAIILYYGSNQRQI